MSHIRSGNHYRDNCFFGDSQYKRYLRYCNGRDCYGSVFEHSCCCHTSHSCGGFGGGFFGNLWPSLGFSFGMGLGNMFTGLLGGLFGGFGNFGFGGFGGFGGFSGFGMGGMDLYDTGFNFGLPMLGTPATTPATKTTPATTTTTETTPTTTTETTPATTPATTTETTPATTPATTTATTTATTPATTTETTPATTTATTTETETTPATTTTTTGNEGVNEQGTTDDIYSNWERFKLQPIEDMKKITKEQAEALLNSAGLTKINDTEYKFDFDITSPEGAAKLILLCKAGVSVGFAENSVMPQKYVHGTIDEIEVDNNGTATHFSINNTGYRTNGEFGLYYIFKVEKSGNSTTATPVAYEYRDDNNDDTPEPTLYVRQSAKSYTFDSSATGGYNWSRNGQCNVSSQERKGLTPIDKNGMESNYSFSRNAIRRETTTEPQ